MKNETTDPLLECGRTQPGHACILAVLVKNETTAPGSGIPRERGEEKKIWAFGPDQFDPAVVAAWLAFYVQAQRKGDASRLLAIYEARLRSNLVYALRQLVPLEAARRIATGLGSLIDGFYLRAALKDFGMSRSDAVAMTLEYLELTLAKEMSS